MFYVLFFLLHLKLLWCLWHFYYLKVTYIYIVLAYGKGPKNSIHKELLGQKTLNKTPRPPAAFYASYIQALSLTDFLKYLQNSIFPKFLHMWLFYSMYHFSYNFISDRKK